SERVCPNPVLTNGTQPPRMIFVCIYLFLTGDRSWLIRIIAFTFLAKNPVQPLFHETINNGFNESLKNRRHQSIIGCDKMSVKNGKKSEGNHLCFVIGISSERRLFGYFCELAGCQIQTTIIHELTSGCLIKMAAGSF